MFGKQITLFTLFGFKVRIDLSWLILAVFITWSLARGVFPYYYKGLSTTAYWWMGIFGAIGLFASIIFHELWHSLVARRFGLPIKEITLFIFGGVANMEEEPPSPKAEFFMAIAGPLASLFLSGIFYGLYIAAQAGNWGLQAVGVVGYLSWLNLILAIFNLIPAFPLDGGRVLRSALWSWKNSLRWATRIASRIGSGFGIFLVVMGVFAIISGGFVGGMWWVLIGMFVLSASKMSYQRLLMRQVLEGEPVRRFMRSDPVAVPPSITIDQLVEEYIYKYHFKMFPVSENHEPVSCVTTRQVKEIPRTEWDQHTVGEIATPCSSENTVAEDTDAMKALSRINRTKNSRLMVVDKNNQLVGILSLKDLLQFLSLKLDLEDEVLEKTGL
jgi:Zn-dependent protease/CBS domain-containing protein